MTIKPKYLLIILFCLFTIPILQYAHLGTYTRLFTDDYCQIDEALHYGVIKNTQQLYQNWSARYTNNLLRGIIAPLDHYGSRFTFAALALCMYIGLFAILKQLSDLFSSSTSKLLNMTIASLVLLLVISAVNSQRGYYWSAGILAHFVGPIIIASTIVPILQVTKTRKFSPLLGSITFTLAFFAAGASAAIAVAQVIGLLSAMIFNNLFLYGEQRAAINKILITTLLGGLIGLVLVIAAPGSSVRVETHVVDTESSHILIRMFMGGLADMIQFTVASRALSALVIAFAFGALTGSLHYRSTQHQETSNEAKHASESIFPTWLSKGGIVLGIAFIFPLYNYQSTHPHILGRYSTTYSAFLLAHTFITTSWVVFHYKRKAIRHNLSQLTNHNRSIFWAVIVTCLLLSSIVPITMMRIYLFLNALLLLSIASPALQQPHCEPNNQHDLFRIGNHWAIRSSYIQILVGCTSALLTMWSYFAITTLAPGGTMPRTLYFPALILIIMVGIPSFLFGRAAPLNTSTTPTTIRGKIALVGLVITLIGLPLYHTVFTLRLLPSYKAYAQAWDSRDAYLHTLSQQNVNAVEIPTLQNDIKGIAEIEEGGTDWLNHCLSAYYDIDTIRLIRQ